MKKQVIAYLHTHWDREWYREFEVFRARLLRVFDNILDMLDTGKIPCFYFDGQVSALEDYLEMRPEKRELIKTLISTKKLYIGPFYCLVDEFLTDKVCFEKNLELGMKYAIEMGCTDFIGYLADTFGHSKNVPDILMEFGIDKCMVWRGCNDNIPSEFKWCGMDTVNMVRGYFQDIFSSECSVEEKAEKLKKELDLISEKSGDILLLPIGGDHLGIPRDINDQIISVNEILKEDYEIVLGSPFDYFKAVEQNFDNYTFDDELRDNSKTFTLQGVYSSRTDLKRYNVECAYMLDLADRYVRFSNKEEKYEKLLEYAYRMLIKNQAHDSICGCSTDDVHSENITRYKKILQIAKTIIEEIKFDTKLEFKNIINLSNKPFSGVIEFEYDDMVTGYECFSTRKGFSSKLLNNINKVPVTEDYKTIYKYLAEVKNIKSDEIDYILTSFNDTDISVTNNSIENSKISLKIDGEKLFINEIPFSVVDFADNGDSYNNAPLKGDYGKELRLVKTKVLYKGVQRAIMKLDFESQWDIVSLKVSIDNNSNYMKFDFDWENSQKNHLLEVKFELPSKIRTVYSEDMNTLIKREFDPDYDIRENLPETKGKEVKTNTAPMQRGLLIDEEANNIGIITKGLTQYEVFKNGLYLPILRSTGIISNPLNTARTTPAGPPIECHELQMTGNCRAEFYVFFGNENTFNDVLSSVYSYIII